MMAEEDGSSRPTSKHKHIFALAETLSRRSHFTPEEIRCLLIMYSKASILGKMDRLHFRELMSTTFDITDDLMLDRIFRAFDLNNDALIDDTEWILGLSVFLRGSLDEQINFCYFVYDINGDRSLTREELYHCLKNCMMRTTGIEEDVEESVKEIVEIALKKLDVDRNGQITFSDFQAAVMSDPLLLEACGPCLPNPRAVDNFFASLANYQISGKLPAVKMKAIEKVKNEGRRSRRQSSINFLR